MTKQEIYNSKLGTLTDALNLIKSDDVVITTYYANEPTSFLEQMHTVADRVQNVRLWATTRVGDYPVFQDNSLKGKIDIVAFFYNVDCRAGHSTGRFSFVPNTLQAVGKTIENCLRPNVFVVSAAPMDEDGNMCVSWDMEISQEALELADTIIVEVNKKMKPSNVDCRIPIERATMVYEVSREMSHPRLPEASEEDIKIGEYAASLINDGDTIQLGFGVMPNIVGEFLKDKKDLGVHSEMFTDTMGQLLKNGVITNERKTFNKGKSYCAFVWGKDELYDIASDPDVVIKSCEYINNPYIIASHDNMISVNAALQVDLTGQICSETLGSRQFSGTGGAMDFAVGAYYSKGGKGIIAIHSTAKNGTVSKIQTCLSTGAAVSIPRNFADYVVTEYGIAKLKYKSVKERVNNLIAIAHPDFREELRRDAEKLMIW